ncbi:NB-ARC domain, LRR domain containing protein [Trema orientale]|uniref:NB-ARC domain, LRR domain containing protein n=1 Tax=Trema orientale TaxID=63057 RepID=A0A2P5DAK6_TREOI|nr:NB-ARC domain, LRR domain containing protein [Trema orientale]
MKELGEKMLEHCTGLPLAITVLGELLSKRRTPNEWKEMLHNNMRTFIHEERRKDQEDLKYSDILWVLGLGYHDLPHNLRQDLLHLAHFPKDSEIKVKELCRIWKAEGFMDIDEGHEATNRRFNMLKDEGLIQVEKLDSYGMIKTIRICNLTRDLCITSDKDGNNFWEIMDSRKEMDQYSSSPDTFEDVKPTYKTHSVAIYVNRDVAEEFFPLINNDRKAGLRTLICFNRLPYPSYEQVIQPLLRRFQKLRVLKFENISYGYVGKLPEEIGELVHLRFLSLKGSHVEQVPSSIGNLIFLQTLDLRTNWKSEFPNVLRRLKQLRHLYLPLRCHISGNKLMFSHLKKIETLVNIPLRYCDLNDRETTNLIYKVRKFKVYFHASLWKDFNLKSSGTSQRRYLDSLALDNLSRSRVDVVQFLSGHRTRKLHLEGKITQLPEEQFVPLLTKLTLERTYLHNDPMETLAKLPELKILLLKHNAFEGNKMVCSHNGFPRLEYLSLIALEQLEEWNVEEGALSSLSNLLIEDCYKLLTIPSGLRNVTKLKKLVIKRMPREFTTKVEERGNDFYKVQHVPSVELLKVLSGFQLNDPSVRCCSRIGIPLARHSFPGDDEARSPAIDVGRVAQRKKKATKLLLFVDVSCDFILFAAIRHHN